MISKILNFLNRHQRKSLASREKNRLLEERKLFMDSGQIPWSKGYHEYKREFIKENITNNSSLDYFRNGKLPKGYGYRLDERSVEYPWIFSMLKKGKYSMLDAGSTFNFEYIVNHQTIVEKDLIIFTFAPEQKSFNEKKISYVYGDLREMPFNDCIFDVVVSQSTIEHIDMDNSMYGYDIPHNENNQVKSYEYQRAISEMIRVLKKGGTLLLTFPFGKFENHGFFQQFDEEMLQRILNSFDGLGTHTTTFFKYEKDGWTNANKEEVLHSESYNPHTGKGKKDDMAAHSRSIACVKFNKV